MATKSNVYPVKCNDFCINSKDVEKASIGFPYRPKRLLIIFELGWKIIRTTKTLNVYTNKIMGNEVLSDLTNFQDRFLSTDLD